MSPDPKNPELYTLCEGASPLILSFPHSGTKIPEDIARNLSLEGQEAVDTDWYVPRLYNFARDLGATWIEAKFSRTVIDLNRDPSGASLYPGLSTTALCPVKSFSGKNLWQENSEPDGDEVERRKQLYFAPYHAALAVQIARVKARYGFAVLYDCHSIRGVNPQLFEGSLPALNLGTHQGQSCARKLQAALDVVLQNSPYTHVTNGRFSGGWITRHYGNPEARVHAVQMEIAQRTYMQEVPPWSWNDARAENLQNTLSGVLDAILQWAGKQI